MVRRFKCIIKESERLKFVLVITIHNVMTVLITKTTKMY